MIRCWKLKLDCFDGVNFKRLRNEKGRVIDFMTLKRLKLKKFF